MKGALLDRIKYTERAVTRGAEARIPFDHSLSREEIDIIANEFAGFVSSTTGNNQTVENKSSHLGVKYYIKNSTHPNYRIYAGIDTLFIEEELICKHRDVLESYLKNLNQNIFK